MLNYTAIGIVIVYFVIDSLFCIQSHCPFSYGIGIVLLLFNAWGFLNYLKQIQKNIKVLWPILLLYFYFLFSGLAYYDNFTSIVGIGKIIWTISPLIISLFAYIMALNVDIKCVTKILVFSLLLSSYGAFIGYMDLTFHLSSAYFFFYSILSFILVYIIHYLLMYNNKMSYALIGLCIIVIILTSKRGALIALSPIVLTFVFLKKGKLRINIKYVILFCLLFLLSFFYFDKYIDTILDRFKEDDTTNYGSGRFYIWYLIQKKYSAGSWFNQLFGFGNYSVYKLTGTRLDHDYSAHSTYLALMFEYGIVGLALYLLMLYKMFKITINAIKKKYEYANIMLSLLLCLILIGVTEYLFEFYMWFFALYLFWHLARLSHCNNKNIRI